MTTTTPNKEKAEPVVLPVDLRDWFAGRAMVALLERDLADAAHAEVAGADNIARIAYLAADAMLEARKA